MEQMKEMTKETDAIDENAVGGLLVGGIGVIDVGERQAFERDLSLAVVVPQSTIATSEPILWNCDLAYSSTDDSMTSVVTKR